MESQDGELAPACPVLQIKLRADGGLLGNVQKVTQGVNHHVADHENALPGTALLEEVSDGIFFGDKEIVGQRVCEDAIDFLGHGAIKAAESSFDVGNADAEFGGGKRNGDGGIHVADDKNEIGLAVDKYRFDALQDFSGLRGVGAGADFQIHVG